MPDLFDRLLLLKQSPAFSLAHTEDLRQVAQALEKQEFFAGERIFEINAQGNHLYILVSGKVGRDLHYNAAGFFDIHVLLGDFNHGSLSKPATFSVRQ